MTSAVHLAHLAGSRVFWLALFSVIFVLLVANGRHLGASVRLASAREWLTVSRELVAEDNLEDGKNETLGVRWKQDAIRTSADADNPWATSSLRRSSS